MLVLILNLGLFPRIITLMCCVVAFDSMPVV